LGRRHGDFGGGVGAAPGKGPGRGGGAGGDVSGRDAVQQSGAVPSMTGLVLKPATKERVLTNGAVIENGDRSSRLSIVTPNANILRLRDAIHPEEVNTPVRRVCYIAQLVLSGDADPDEARHQLYRGIEQLGQVLTDPDSRGRLE